MGSFIVRRIMMTLVVILAVTFFCFILIHLLPGDPVLTILGQQATPESIAVLRAELGLDRPIHEQYFNWLGNVLRGDLGKSIIFGDSVSDLIQKRLPITLHLTCLALIIAVVFGVSIGIFSAVARGSFLDQLLTVCANMGVAIPVFWLGLLGIYLFGLILGWLPIQGYTSPFSNFWYSTQQLIMPVLCMAVIPVSVMARQSRSSMLEVIRQDYIRTANAKGLAGNVVIVRHALKNALIPIVTLLGLRVPELFAGSVLVETVFNIPGMGRLLVTALFNKDFVIVQAVVLVIATVVAIVNLLVDISYGWLDPRIRYK